MTTGLEIFKRKMEPARQLYTREIADFTGRYDALGDLATSEFPDIDCQEYIFEFETVKEISQKQSDEILMEIHYHMEDFAEVHGIEDFCQWVRILL